jgi:hypothetical protein
VSEHDAYNRPSPPYSDEYYLAMAALDQYPIDDGILKSTSIVFRIHQLGHALERLTAALDPDAIRCQYCGEDLRFMAGFWLDRETHSICDPEKGYMERKHEPPPLLSRPPEPDWIGKCPRCGRTVLNHGDLCSSCAEKGL